MFHHEKGFLFGVPINISDAWGKHARMKWVNGIKILLTHGYSWRNFLPANLPWIFDHHFSTFHGYISLGNKKVLSGHFVYPPNSSCKMSTTSEGLKSFRGFEVRFSGVGCFSRLYFDDLCFHTFMPPLTCVTAGPTSTTLFSRSDFLQAKHLGVLALHVTYRDVFAEWGHNCIA